MPARSATSDGAPGRPPSGPSGGRDVTPLRQTADGGDFVGTYVIGLLLNLVTLGIYHFWLKTDIRRYLWSRVEADDDPFEYTGTGGELFKGFLVAVFLVLLPVSLLYQLVLAQLLIVAPAAGSIAAGVLVLFNLWLVGVAYFSVRRFRLTRTRWRGIRANQTGSRAAYGLRFLLAWIANLATLGLTLPAMRVMLTRYELSRMEIGDRGVTFGPPRSPLYPTYLLCWVLLLPTLGLSWFWFQARWYRHLAERVRFGPLGFDYRATGGQLARLAIGNLLILSFTFGLLAPFTWARTLRVAIDNLTVTGRLEPEWLGQNRGAVPTMGEGLFDALDLG